MKGGEASGESVHTILKFSREEGSNKHLPEARKVSGYAYTVICQKYSEMLKENPYIINQNHIFSKNYCEVISG